MNVLVKLGRISKSWVFNYKPLSSSRLIRVWVSQPLRTLVTSSSSSSSNTRKPQGTIKESTFYTKLFSSQRPIVLVDQIVGHWIVVQGKGIAQVKSELQSIINRFIKFKRFKHALQVISLSNLLSPITRYVF